MKESKSNTKSAVKLLLGLLGALAFLVSYYMLLPRLKEQNEALEKENSVLKEQQRIINDLAANEEVYAQKTELYEQEIADIIEKYPAGILEEDVILFARLLEKEQNFSVPTIGISTPNHLFSMNAQGGISSEPSISVPAGGVDLGILDANSIVCPDYNLYSVEATYSFKTDYSHVKTGVAAIQSYPDKRNVPNISLTRDGGSGNMNGNMTVNLYFLTNTGKIYHKPDAGVIVKGSDNPFGTLNLPLPDDTQDSQEDEGGGESEGQNENGN